MNDQSTSEKSSAPSLDEQITALIEEHGINKVSAALFRWVNEMGMPPAKRKAS